MRKHSGSLEPECYQDLEPIWLHNSPRGSVVFNVLYACIGRRGIIDQVTSTLKHVDIDPIQ